MDGIAGFTGGRQRGGVHPRGVGIGGAPAGQAAGNPLALAARRLDWLDRRQAVLAQNVANADTPRFRPSDLAPFAQELAGQMRLALARTQAGHGAGSPASASGARPERRPAEVSPDGNAVSLDREAVRIAETDTAHQLAMAVHQRFTGMFRTTLGR
ncbi:flagellar basal body rod protein FlgB [Falsiroseomonas sp. HW251]|uniref:flagellar basal body rod protein FlgB n=1 Tax=Falsiroseomonas sp. HW251 TaxID=3390998 RepID=UPI003D31A1AB